ncbi:MAG TPA: HU family DNA-binding protein [Gemmataceae bacterium]|nr:HU family DNA-binding protein [Gemmataceae bacterium]
MRKLLKWTAGGVLTAVAAGLTFAAPIVQPDKPAPADKDKPAVAAPADKDKPPAPAPAEKDKPAAPAPADKDKAAAKDKEKPKAPPTSTLQGRIAAQTKLSEDDVNKVLKALGPALRDDLAHGGLVELPGLGTFRVVRIAAHRDLVNGRPAMIEASNYVEFLPSGGLVDAANAAGAVPQDTVQPFQFNPLPNQTKSLVMPDDRMPNIRVP